MNIYFTFKKTKKESTWKMLICIYIGAILKFLFVPLPPFLSSVSFMGHMESGVMQTASHGITDMGQNVI